MSEKEPHEPYWPLAAVGGGTSIAGLVFAVIAEKSGASDPEQARGFIQALGSVMGVGGAVLFLTNLDI